MNELTFNLDLTLIENTLKQDATLHVEKAMKMPDLVSKPVSRTTLFVLPLGEFAEPDAAVSAFDVEQRVTDKFGVLIALNSKGSMQGVHGRDELLKLREQVKSHIVGLVIADFEPVYFESGALIDANVKTQNLLYQCQFVTSRTVTTGVKNYGD